MTLAQATTYCAGLQDCCGFWFVEESGKCVSLFSPFSRISLASLSFLSFCLRCEPMATWDPSPSNFALPVFGGAFYKVKELPEGANRARQPMNGFSRTDSESICFFSDLPLQVHKQSAVACDLFSIKLRCSHKNWLHFEAIACVSRPEIKHAYAEVTFSHPTKEDMGNGKTTRCICKQANACFKHISRLTELAPWLSLADCFFHSFVVCK